MWISPRFLKKASDQIIHLWYIVYSGHIKRNIKGGPRCTKSPGPTVKTPKANSMFMMLGKHWTNHRTSPPWDSLSHEYSHNTTLSVVVRIKWDNVGPSHKRHSSVHSRRKLVCKMLIKKKSSHKILAMQTAIIYTQCISVDTEETWELLDVLSLWNCLGQTVYTKST